MATKQAAPKAAGPGQYYDIPGVGGGTQWTEQFESVKSLATTMAVSTSTPVNGLLPFKQTDVVVDWEWDLSVAQVYTAGGATFAASDYAPWNLIGRFTLPIQNQYASVDVDNGIDLYIFNIARPWNEHDRTLLGYNPSGATVGAAAGYPEAANAQPNLSNTAQYSAAGLTWNTILRIPAAACFDVYYDLTLDGQPNPNVPPHQAIVSPQYMAGSARIITPSITLAPLTGNADVSPVSSVGGAPTISAVATSTFRRKAAYSANPALEPPVYRWQYRWHTDRFAVPGTSDVTLPVPQETGQLLFMYIRLFDPAAAAGVGAPISLSSLTNIELQYGSGLLRWQGTPRQLQIRWMQQHGVMLPKGVLPILDLCLDEYGNRTNKRALNLLTTAGVNVRMQFSSPTSTTAYAVMGCESLVFVA